jgi:hypothetical protein
MPTQSPTSTPTLTIPPSASPGGNNMTCEVWGDPKVNCFNGNQFSSHPGELTNFTIIYQMDDRLMLVGELNQTRNSANGMIETYVENAYLWMNGQWNARFRRKDCRLDVPQLRTASTADQVDPKFELVEGVFAATQEYVIINGTCHENGLDLYVNKLSANEEALENPLQWELDQPDYGGMCLTCNSVFYDNEHGPIPVASESVRNVAIQGRSPPSEQDDLNRSLNDDSTPPSNGSANAISTVFIAVVSMLFLFF